MGKSDAKIVDAHRFEDLLRIAARHGCWKVVDFLSSDSGHHNDIPFLHEFLTLPRSPTAFMDSVLNTTEEMYNYWLSMGVVVTDDDRKHALGINAKCGNADMFKFNLTHLLSSFSSPRDDFSILSTSDIDTIVSMICCTKGLTFAWRLRADTSFVSDVAFRSASIHAKNVEIILAFLMDVGFSISPSSCLDLANYSFEHYLRVIDRQPVEQDEGARLECLKAAIRNGEWHTVFESTKLWQVIESKFSIEEKRIVFQGMLQTIPAPYSMSVSPKACQLSIALSIEQLFSTLFELLKEPNLLKIEQFASFLSKDQGEGLVSVLWKMTASPDVTRTTSTLFEPTALKTYHFLTFLKLVSNRKSMDVVWETNEVHFSDSLRTEFVLGVLSRFLLDYSSPSSRAPLSFFAGMVFTRLFPSLPFETVLNICRSTLANANPSDFGDLLSSVFPPHYDFANLEAALLDPSVETVDAYDAMGNWVMEFMRAPHLATTFQFATIIANTSRVESNSLWRFFHHLIRLLIEHKALGKITVSTIRPYVVELYLSLNDRAVTSIFIDLLKVKYLTVVTVFKSFISPRMLDRFLSKLRDLGSMLQSGNDCAEKETDPIFVEVEQNADELMTALTIMDTTLGKDFRFGDIVPFLTNQKTSDGEFSCPSFVGAPKKAMFCCKMMAELVDKTSFDVAFIQEALRDFYESLSDMEIRLLFVRVLRSYDFGLVVELKRVRATRLQSIADLAIEFEEGHDYHLVILMIEADLPIPKRMNKLAVVTKFQNSSDYHQYRKVIFVEILSSQISYCDFSLVDRRRCRIERHLRQDSPRESHDWRRRREKEGEGGCLSGRR